MATKVRDILVGACRRIGYLDPGERLSAADAADVLSTLNDMMFAWKNSGLTYVHAALKINDEFPLGPEFNTGVQAMLAVQLTDTMAPEAMTRQLQLDANDGWNALCRIYFSVPKSSFDLPYKRWDRV